MKTGNLLITTVLTVFLTGFVFAHADWLPTRKLAHAGQHHADSQIDEKSHDPAASSAGRRWLACQPHHWHSYMIQH
jgi:hypothetical protein